MRHSCSTVNRLTKATQVPLVIPFCASASRLVEYRSHIALILSPIEREDRQGEQEGKEGKEKRRAFTTATMAHNNSFRKQNSEPWTAWFTTAALRLSLRRKNVAE